MLWTPHIPGFGRQGLAAALRRRFLPSGRRLAAAFHTAAWRRDPLSHPALAAMSQRQLGDLPFDPYAVDAD